MAGVVLARGLNPVGAASTVRGCRAARWNAPDPLAEEPIPRRRRGQEAARSAEAERAADAGPAGFRSKAGGRERGRSSGPSLDSGNLAHALFKGTRQRGFEFFMTVRTQARGFTFRFPGGAESCRTPWCRLGLSSRAKKEDACPNTDARPGRVAGASRRSCGASVRRRTGSRRRRGVRRARGAGCLAQTGARQLRRGLQGGAE